MRNSPDLTTALHLLALLWRRKQASAKLCFAFAIQADLQSVALQAHTRMQCGGKSMLALANILHKQSEILGKTASSANSADHLHSSVTIK